VENTKRNRNTKSTENIRNMKNAKRNATTKRNKKVQITFTFYGWAEIFQSTRRFNITFCWSYGETFLWNLIFIIFIFKFYVKSPRRCVLLSNFLEIRYRIELQLELMLYTYGCCCFFLRKKFWWDLIFLMHGAKNI